MGPAGNGGEGGLENGDFGIFFGYQELDGHSRHIEPDFYFYFLFFKYELICHVIIF